MLSASVSDQDTEWMRDWTSSPFKKHPVLGLGSSSVSRVHAAQAQGPEFDPIEPR